MTKKTHYELFPTQYDFAFGINEEERKKADIKDGKGSYMDFALYNGGFTCVPADTEYLSPTGWEKIKNLTKEKQLAVYTKDGFIRFEKPLEVFKWGADRWYNFNTRFIHQTLCPNHKIVYWNDRHPEKIETIRCEDYINKGCNQHYKIKNYFKSSGNGFTGLTEEELRILVAYQADGYDYQAAHHTGKRKIGFHLKKRNKIIRLISLLLKTDKPFSYKKRESGIKKGYYDIFSELDVAKFKHFPKEWYNLNDKELSIIFDEVKYWDCSHKRAGSWTYYSNNKDDRDFIQFVCASQGYCTTTYERTRDVKITQQGKEYQYKNKTEYSVSWTKGKLLSMGKPSIEIAKGGDAKYCPSTTTGMWLARCKNHIFVTGNS